MTPRLKSAFAYDLFSRDRRYRPGLGVPIYVRSHKKCDMCGLARAQYRQVTQSLIWWGDNTVTETGIRGISIRWTVLEMLAVCRKCWQDSDNRSFENRGGEGSVDA